MARPESCRESTARGDVVVLRIPDMFAGRPPPCHIRVSILLGHITKTTLQSVYIRPEAEGEEGRMPSSAWNDEWVDLEPLWNALEHGTPAFHFRVLIRVGRVQWKQLEHLIASRLPTICSNQGSALRPPLPQPWVVAQSTSRTRFLCCYFSSLRPLRPNLLRASDEEERERKKRYPHGLFNRVNASTPPLLFFDGSLAGRSN